jgi:hypothetical protein
MFGIIQGPRSGFRFQYQPNNAQKLVWLFMLTQSKEYYREQQGKSSLKFPFLWVLADSNCTLIKFLSLSVLWGLRMQEGVPIEYILILDKLAKEIQRFVLFKLW